MALLKAALGGLGNENKPYCLLSKKVFSLNLPILFVRFGAFIEKNAIRSSLGSRRSLWNFLASHPHVLVVLIPDDDFSIRDARLGKLVPSLGNRIIGSIDDSMLDPTLSINIWREHFGAGSRYAIFDDRISFYDDRSKLIPIVPINGLTQLNIEHAIGLLKLADNIITDPSLTHVEILEIAVSLQLGGQEKIATQLLHDLVYEVLDYRPEMKQPDGEPKPAIADFLEQRNSLENYYRLARYLGVRLRVTSEAAT